MTPARFLLDTHVLLWWLSEPERLSAAARAAIGGGEIAAFVSAAAVWEMAIKKTLGRLDFPANLIEVLKAERIRVLPIDAAHALAVAELPLHHQDPFDRMMIAQARLEGLTLITRDRELARYGVAVIDA